MAAQKNLRGHSFLILKKALTFCKIISIIYNCIVQLMFGIGKRKAAFSHDLRFEYRFK